MTQMIIERPDQLAEQLNVYLRTVATSGVL